MTSFDPADRRRDYEALRLAWREATAEWLDARGQYERIRCGAGGDRQRLLEAAHTYAFASHRRCALARDVERYADAFDACPSLRATRTSER
jgi:hypothetical protein